MRSEARIRRRMRSFWEARAREHPLWFVDDRLDLEALELDRFWEGGREGLDLMFDALGVAIEPGDELVEIGCGVGRVTRVLAERGASVRALDISSPMLEQARELNPGLDNVEWILGDGTSLGAIETGSADACVSLVVFHHLPDPAIALGYVREVGRVLRAGGWAALQVSNEPAVHRPPGPLRRLHSYARARLGHRHYDPHHAAWRGSAVDLAELERAGGEAGLALERVVGASTPFCLVLLRRASS